MSLSASALNSSCAGPQLATGLPKRPAPCEESRRIPELFQKALNKIVQFDEGFWRTFVSVYGTPVLQSYSQLKSLEQDGALYPFFRRLVSSGEKEMLKRFPKNFHPNLLAQSVKASDLKTTEYLLKVGTSPDSLLPEGEATNECGTVLHLGIMKSDAPTVRAIIAAGANVELANLMGETPLNLATRVANADVVKILLDAEADTETASLALLETPLHRATSRSSSDIVGLLLDRGNANKQVIDIFGNTPESLARRSSDAGLMALFSS